MRRIARNPEVLVVMNPALPFNTSMKGKTMKRRKSRRSAARRGRKTHYNRMRKHSRRTRRNKGKRGGSAWSRHAAKFLRAGKSLKQASAAWKR